MPSHTHGRVPPRPAPPRSAARRLSALQQIPAGEAATPAAVASALRDLDIDTFFGRILFNRCGAAQQRARQDACQCGRDRSSRSGRRGPGLRSGSGHPLMRPGLRTLQVTDSEETDAQQGQAPTVHTETPSLSQLRGGWGEGGVGG